MSNSARKPYKQRVVNAQQKIEAHIRAQANTAPDKTATASVSQLMSDLGVARRSVQQARRTMAESGRWDVSQGGGTSTTTYRLLED